HAQQEVNARSFILFDKLLAPHTINQQVFPKGVVPMRFLTSFLCILLLSGVLFAQKQLLVTPYQEVIPIPRGSSAQKMIQKIEKEHGAASLTDGCNGGALFGFDPTHFPTDSRFGFSHKDVMGEWFVAPARGTIDTFFFVTNGTIASLDSQVIVRIFKSNL